MFTVFDIQGEESYIEGAILSKLLMLFFIKVIEKISKFHGDIDVSISSWGQLMFIPLASIFININIFELVEKSENVISTVNSLISSILILILNIVIFGIYDKLINNIDLKNRNMIYEKQLSMYQLNIETEKEEIKGIRRLRHDMKSQLLGLRALIEEDRIIELRQTLDEMISERQLDRGDVIHSGNIILDNFINHKIAIAKKYEIDISTKVKIPMNIDIMLGDLFVVLGNALDNAIENTIKIQPDNRFISISMSYRESCLNIGIKNSFNGKIKKNINGFYKSTKPFSENHGIGLSSIERVVEKYDGQYDVSYDDKFFYLVVTIYEKEKLHIKG